MKKKGKFSYFHQSEEKRDFSLFNKMLKIGIFPYMCEIRKKGFKKGNFISPFSNAFWPDFSKVSYDRN